MALASVAFLSLVIQFTTESLLQQVLLCSDKVAPRRHLPASKSPIKHCKSVPAQSTRIDSQINPEIEFTTAEGVTIATSRHLNMHN